MRAQGSDSHLVMSSSFSMMPFPNSLSAFSWGWDRGWLRREGQAGFELPPGVAGMELLPPPWPAPTGPFSNLA